VKLGLILCLIILLFPFSKYIQCQNLLNGPNDIVFDLLNNRYLVSCWEGNNIIAIDVQGNQSVFKSNVTRAHGSEIKDSILFIASYHNILLIDLFTSTTIKNINVPGSEYLGHIALDSSNNVYISDWSAKKLFKIKILDESTSTLASLSDTPLGVYFEENNSRLILLTFINNAPILAVSLPDGNITTIRTSNINVPDAICRDSGGNYYISSFADNIIYRLNYDLSGDPEIISTGHSGPSGLGYNSRDNILGITNYDINSIDLIELGTTGIESERSRQLENFRLEQNYPNPFNPTTSIKYDISVSTKVVLKIYNIMGKEVKTLVNEDQSAGIQSIIWNGTDNSGNAVSSGVYIFSLQIGRNSQSKKMVLMK